MLKLLFLAIVMLTVCPSAYAVDPDEFIGLEFRQREQGRAAVAAPQAKALGQIPEASPRGKVWTDPTTGMQFVWIPGGCFLMGQSSSERNWLAKQLGRSTAEDWFKNERPQHEICVDGFWMGRFEVTNAQYSMFREIRHGYDRLPNGKQLSGRKQPVVFVSWDEAMDYARWLSSKSNGRFRLPTEAEWEYAARAGTSGRNFWGDSDAAACTFANLFDQTLRRKQKGSSPIFPCEDGYVFSAPVGSFKPNSFGLYDMMGNVNEWCDDSYVRDAYLKSGRRHTVYHGGNERIIRGGGYYSEPVRARAAYRDVRFHEQHFGETGFRLVRDR